MSTPPANDLLARVVAPRFAADWSLLVSGAAVVQIGGAEAYDPATIAPSDRAALESALEVLRGEVRDATC